jgi:hypothetical protein
MFMTLTPDVNVRKLFSSSLAKIPNKLKCLLKTRISILVYFLRIRLKPTLVKYISATKLWGRLQTLPGIIN